MTHPEQTLYFVCSGWYFSSGVRFGMKKASRLTTDLSNRALDAHRIQLICRSCVSGFAVLFRGLLLLIEARYGSTKQDRCPYCTYPGSQHEDSSAFNIIKYMMQIQPANLLMGTDCYRNVD